MVGSGRSNFKPTTIMEAKENQNAKEEDEYTMDGSVDLKGNPVLRSNTGGWKACSFIVVYEVFERMAYYGISSNLVLYLTRKLHMGTVTSANNVTNWVGTVFLTPVLGAYVADALLGRYWTFIISSFIYLSGICLLTLAVSVHPLKPLECHEANPVNCKHATTLQLGVFFAALYIIALGTGGTKPNISTIGADQFDEFHSKERKQKFSFFNWWIFSVFFGTLFANTVLVYIQDNVGWTLGYGIPAIGLTVSIIIFLAGTPFYRHKPSLGSPITTMSMVFVAAVRKWKVDLPNDPKELHELDLEEYVQKWKTRMDSTSSIRFLNKAAVKVGSATPWRLCSVTQVEETKRMLSLLPIWCTCFVPCAIDAQVNTLFIKQGTTLDRTMGSHFNIPPASLAAFVTVSMLISVVLYDRYLMSFMRRLTKNPRGITLLQRIGCGHVLKTTVVFVASLTERYRLQVASKNGLVENGGVVPLTVFILLPQFVLMGVAHTFYIVGILEFFYDQAPDTMKSLGTSFSLTALGVGNFLSSFLVSMVDKITRRNGHRGWIMNNLNASHLDYFYAFLTVLGVLNFIIFLCLCRLFTYKIDALDSKTADKDRIEIRENASC